MAPTVAWMGALRRLPRRAFRQASTAERIPILNQVAPSPARSWKRPQLRISEHERGLEFELHLAGAQADTTRVYWSEHEQTFTVHALARYGEPGIFTRADTANNQDWYIELPVPGDVDGSHAEAFLRNGILRIVAPRADVLPLTGLPLWVKPEAPLGWSLALGT